MFYQKICLINLLTLLCTALIVLLNILGSLNWKKHGAELFPCASGVQAPYVGQTDSTFITSKELTTTPASLSDNSFLADEIVPQKSNKKTLPKPRILGDVVDPFAHRSIGSLQDLLPQTCLDLPDVGKKRGKKQKQQKMKEISKGLNFTNDVLAYHCSHLIDYDEETLNKTVYQGARCGRQRFLHLTNKQGTHPGLPPKHKLCYPNTPKQNTLVHKPKAFADIDDQMKRELDEILFSVAKTTRPFRSSVNKTEQSKKSTQSNAEWDEYVLALLSKSTAKWLSDELSTGPQQARLTNFLKSRYHEDEKDDIETDAVLQPKEEANKRRNSKFAAELDKVLTDANLEPHYTPSFTLPSAVGDKKFTTDNIFQQEMMAGAFPVRGRRAPRKSIVLDTNSHLKFEKKLQANFPEDPKKWSQGRRNSKAVKLTTNSKVVKGLQRWNELPELLQVRRLYKRKKFVNLINYKQS